MQGVSLTHFLFFFFIWGVSLTHPVLVSFFYRGSFSYTSRAGFIFIWGVSLTHPMLASWNFSYTSSRAGFNFISVFSLTHPMLVFFFKLSGEFLLDISHWLHFYAGSFSYTSHSDRFYAGNLELLYIPCWLLLFFFSFFFFFFFYLGSFSYTSRAGFIFIWGVSLIHPVLVLFLCRECLLHIPCCLHFCTGSLSHTYCAAFIFMRGVSLTHPMLASF